MPRSNRMNLRRTSRPAALVLVGALAAGCAVAGPITLRPIPAVPLPDGLTIIAAGVPKYRADANQPDYDACFAELAAHGISVFFPTFQYRELPTPLSLGHEVDFVPPCTPNDPAVVAMHAHGVELLVPGGLIYEPGNYPPIDDDPLARLIACFGRASIHGVLSFDEPSGSAAAPQTSTAAVSELYQRVKQIDPTIPVLMVHAPITAFVDDGAGGERPITQAEIDDYLAAVAALSQYADVVGFDVYPIPAQLVQLTSPYQGGAVVDYRTAVPEYLQWLAASIPHRAYFLALQAFSYDDLWGEEGMPDPPPGLRPPTAEELMEMACLARSSGATRIVWWGQSFLTSEDVQLWNDVLAVSAQIASDPGAACGRGAARPRLRAAERP